MAKASTQVKILVPGSQPMVALLGQRDELLKLVESAFDSQILVRGNEITISGPEKDLGSLCRHQPRKNREESNDEAVTRRLS